MALGHAADRLPHASRVRRQPRREFEARLNGATYRTSPGRGGIKRRSSHARGERGRARGDGPPRLEALAAEGVTTVEIKSGYGLATEAECRQLRARGAWRRTSASTSAPRCSPPTRCPSSSTGARRLHRPRVSRNHSRGRRARGRGRRVPRDDRFTRRRPGASLSRRGARVTGEAPRRPASTRAAPRSPPNSARCRQTIRIHGDAGSPRWPGPGRSRCCSRAPFICAREAIAADRRTARGRRAHGRRQRL